MPYGYHEHDYTQTFLKDAYCIVFKKITLQIVTKYIHKFLTKEQIIKHFFILVKKV